MQIFFLSVYSFVVLQRFAELLLAKRNSQRLIAMGGYEVGAWQHKWFVILHASVFILLPIEFFLRNEQQLPDYWGVFFIIFVISQCFRYWIIRTLGIRWNTRIYVVPGVPLIRSGPYRWVKHPNYIVVIVELIALPLLFGALFTAIAATSANAILLSMRIPLEERALAIGLKQRKLKHVQ